MIPCFGVHPWFAHQHALDPAAAAAADPAALLDVPANGKDHPSGHPDLMARLAPAPPDAWLPRLRALLLRNPHAVVGEFGLDRAAVVPGTRLQVWFPYIPPDVLSPPLRSSFIKPPSGASPPLPSAGLRRQRNFAVGIRLASWPIQHGCD